ncbi:hypothetical protein ACSBR1_013218 [Camellia fascicularis]
METFAIENHRMKFHKMILSFEPDKETIHLAVVKWWIEGARMTIKSTWKDALEVQRYRLQMASMRIVQQDYRKINRLMDRPDHMVPPDLPNKGSMNLLFWTCQGAGNKIFKRNLIEIIRVHRLDILVLMETKVNMSSMGMYFNNLGLTASSNVDPIGRSGGIYTLEP